MPHPLTVRPAAVPLKLTRLIRRARPCRMVRSKPGLASRPSLFTHAYPR